jgi:DNA-binding beta-propeller fold protein YncE
MQKFWRVLAVGAALTASIGLAQQTGPYKVLKTVKVGGGDGGFDYVFADVEGRKLYVARSGQAGHIAVFNLDTLEPAGDITGVSAHGATVDPKSNHGFATSKPVAMFDSNTLTMIKTIDVQGGPDGYLFDSFNQRVYILSHSQPNATVLDAKDGSVVGTIDMGGAPEQAATDGKGHIYVDIEDKGNIAVIDARTMAVTAHYDLQGKGGTCAGLALDVKNDILFAACRSPQTMVILSAKDGKILETLPIGGGTDGAGFNPNTMEAFSSQGDGTLTIVKENSPTSFVVEQTVQTVPRAKTMALDTKTNQVYLIAAEYAAPPPPPPPAPGTDAPPAAGGGRGGRGGRGGPMVPGSFEILVVGK